MPPTLQLPFGSNFSWDDHLPFGKVPNQLVLKKEGLPLDYLAKYKVRNRAHQIYKAAAKLWAEGLAWERALAIVTEAFDAATYEPEG